MKDNKVPRYIQWISLTCLMFLVVMSILRFVLVWVFRTPSQKSISLTDAYLLGIRYDLRIVCILALVLFLLGLIPGFHPIEKKWGRKLGLWICSIFSFVFVLFYAIDFANYSYLSQRLNASLINYMEDTKTSLGMIWQTYPVGWILLGLVAGFLLLLSLVKFIYNKVLSRQRPVKRSCRLVWGILFFLALGLGIFGRIGQYPLRWSDAFSLGNDFAANVALNPFQSFFSSLNFRHSTYDKDKVKEAYSWMSRFLGVKNTDSVSFNYEREYIADSIPSSKANVVIVICESFSAYKSSMYGNPLNTTPYFNQLCENGIFFNRCFTPTYGTARGVWAVVTGIPDVQLSKTASRNPSAVNQHSIINDFKGYEKFYFIGGSTSWANIRGLLTNNIEDLHLYEQENYKAEKVDVWGISDKNLFLEANNVLAKQEKPFIAIIQTADNHRPYTIPEEDQKEFKLVKVSQDSLKKCGFASLDEFNAFRYTDFSYQKFMEAAAKSPYFNNTIFVFVGDHGIPGDAGKMFPQAWTSQSLTAEHVPLLFYAPQLLQPKQYDFYSSQVDILPTIAGMCKIPYTNTTLGRNLLDSTLVKTSDPQSHCSFIFDPDKRRIGIVMGDYFYSYGINNSSQEQISSVINDDKVVLTDSLRKQYRSVANAFYETARYMLLNNKKKN